MISSKKHLSSLLGYKIREIENIIENLDNYYYEFKKPKRDKEGKIITDSSGEPIKRKICPSMGVLKDIQKRINTKILSKFNFPDNIHGGIKNHDNVTNAKVHLGKKYRFCSDLKDCFPSINQKMVYDVFIENGFSPDVASLLTKLTTYNYQVPQGIPTSSYITNIVLLKLDFELNEFCKKNDIYYTRFIDDLSFSSSKPFKDKTIVLLEIIKKYGFKINNKKTFYKIGPTEITGVLTKNNVLDVTKKFKQKMQMKENLNNKSKMVGYKSYYDKVRNK